MDVSVVIINYNTQQMTSDCIDSVLSNTIGVEYEIILVDNASTDGSKEFFEQDKRVKYIYNTENRGFGAGNNIGVKHACGKYIFLLNSDTLLKNNAIKMLYDYSESYSYSCVCGAWLVDKAGNPNVSEIAFPRMNVLEFIKSFVSKKNIFDTSETVEVDNVCGADMFLSRHLFQQVGGFDENIFMYGEEIELQYRLMLLGVKRLIVRGPQIIHFGGGSSSNKSLSFFRSHFYFLKKHMTFFNYYAARTYYAFNFMMRKIYSPSTVSIKDAFIKI